MIHDDAETFAEDLKKTLLLNRHTILYLAYTLDEVVKELDLSEKELQQIARDAQAKAADDALDEYPDDLEQIGILQKMESIQNGNLDVESQN